VKHILVTGGAGFIGSNFVQYLLSRYQDVQVVNLDALTYAGNLENLKGVEQDPRYTFVKGDIRDKELVNRIFEKYAFDTVVNFAAESHVDRSITQPEIFLTTNIVGTQTLLNAAKQAWKLNPEDKYSREYQPNVKYLQVSTDEVYGALGATGMFTEQTPLSPNSPYSASKAGADLIVRAYHETYGMPVNITRCSNNYGPYQFPEKLIPLMIHNCLENRPLPVYGDGMQVRDWLYVEDHCSAICAVLEKGAPGQVYNIGGNNEKANIEIVRLLLRSLDKGEELITYVKDRPGHDRRYAIDNSKITTQLGWEPAYSFDQGMDHTIRWYLEHQDWMERVTSGAYQSYYTDMYGQKSDGVNSCSKN
jgi:dTDP-glucose 4,6-dehydratase